MRSGPTRTPLLAAAAIPLLLGACGTAIRVPPSDPTPPELTLTVRGFEDEHVLTPGGAPVALDEPVHAGRAILLLAVAEDEDGGVRNVAISGEITFTCVRGDIGARSTASYLEENPDGTAVGEEARTVRTTAINFRVSRFETVCRGRGDGYALERPVTGTFTATAENFGSGVVSTPALSFTIR